MRAKGRDHGIARRFIKRVLPSSSTGMTQRAGAGSQRRSTPRAGIEAPNECRASSHSWKRKVAASHLVQQFSVPPQSTGDDRHASENSKSIHVLAILAGMCGCRASDVLPLPCICMFICRDMPNWVSRPQEERPFACYDDISAEDLAEADKLRPQARCNLRTIESLPYLPNAQCDIVRRSAT